MRMWASWIILIINIDREQTFEKKITQMCPIHASSRINAFSLDLYIYRLFLHWQVLHFYIYILQLHLQVFHTKILTKAYRPLKIFSNENCFHISPPYPVMAMVNQHSERALFRLLLNWEHQNMITEIIPDIISISLFSEQSL